MMDFQALSKALSSGRFQEKFNTNVFPNKMEDMPDYEKYLKDKKELHQRAAKQNLSDMIRMCHIEPLINHKQEIWLFEQMNYHKCKGKAYLDQYSATFDDNFLKLANDQWKLCEPFRTVIVLSNMRLAVSIVNKNKMISELDELLSEGFAAVCRSADGFDPSKNFKFSTYTTYSVRNSKRQYYDYFNRNHGERLFEENLSERSYISNSPWDIENSEVIEVLKKNTDLTDRQWELFHLRFIKEKTLDECGTAMGFTRERARQVEFDVLKGLKKTAFRSEMNFEF